MTLDTDYLHEERIADLRDARLDGKLGVFRDGLRDVIVLPADRPTCRARLSSSNPTGCGDGTWRADRPGRARYRLVFRIASI